MSDSAQHLALVNSILALVRRDFSPRKFVVLSDLPGSLDKPPRINGFVPDVFAEDAPRTAVVVGEAKTIQDLQTAHSRLQIAAFLRFLAAQQNGIFVLAVPWPAIATARQIVELELKQLEPQNVKVVISDGYETRAAANPSK
jgi:hypothetical protein